MSNEHKEPESHSFLTIPDVVFPSRVVKNLLETELQNYLGDKSYHSEETLSWSKELADELKFKFKRMNVPRYKIAVQVHIGENRGQGMCLQTRSFWDANTDSTYSASFQNKTLWATATVYFVFVYSK
ncbi:hypothetical protein PCE1_004082 [Barthelona sp. PCE]